MSPADPSAWLLRYESELRQVATLGPVLDLASGRGRHASQVAAWGLPAVALDRRRDALRELRPSGVGCLVADLEGGHTPPLRAASFGAVLVFRYLHRPLVPAIAQWLVPGGLLLYQTFTTAQARLDYGPSNPAFLLEPGELPRLFPGLEIMAHEEGPSANPRPLQLASLAARRPEAT